MNDAVQKLLERYKVDNSRETTDAIANALAVAVEALGKVKQNYQYSGASVIAEDAVNKIQSIAEAVND